MKRADLIRRIVALGAELIRDKGPHTYYRNPRTGQGLPVPRHNEIKEYLARQIIRDASFAKSLRSAPAIGSWIVEYSLTREGTIRDFSPTWVAYYEKESPREVALDKGDDCQATICKTLVGGSYSTRSDRR